jgi:hypothetical protein
LPVNTLDNWRGLRGLGVAGAGRGLAVQKVERKRKVRRARSDLTGEGCIVDWNSSENGEMVEWL